LLNQTPGQIEYNMGGVKNMMLEDSVIDAEIIQQALFEERHIANSNW